MNNFLQFSDKKATCLTRTEIKDSQIPRKRELNWTLLSISSKRSIFFNFKTTIILFDFIFLFWRSTILFSRTLYLFFQVTLCNQPIQRYGTGTFKPYLTPVWTIGFSTVTYIELWWSVKDLPKNTLKI